MGGQTLQAVVAFEGVVGKSVKESIKKVNSSFGGINKKALATAAAMGAAFAGIAGVAYKATRKIYDLGVEFESAYKTIRVGTGATGEALQGLKDDFKAVYSAVPASMADTSQAIADLNTRLGLSGPALQEVSQQALLLSDNLGAGNLTGIIEKSSQAFTAWNIPADKMADKMNFIFKASQSTGMSFENLAQAAQQNAQTFQALGYDFETTVTLIGQMEKNGLNTTDVFTGMKKAVQEISKTGKNANEVFKNYYKQIAKATTETEAITIASEIFGDKSAPAMAAAIRAGKIDVAKLAAELSNSTENIKDLAWETMSLGDKFKVLSNKAKVALEPVAMALLDFINDALPTIQELAKQAIPIFKNICAYIRDIWRGGVEAAKAIKRNWDVIAPVVIGISSALIAYKSIIIGIATYQKVAAVAQAIYTTALGVCTGATVTATGATTALGAAIAFVTSPIFLAAAAIGLLCAAGYMLYKNWDEVCEGAEILGEQIAEVWTNIKDWVVGTVSAIWSKITGFFSGIANFIKTNWKTIIMAAMNPLTLIIPFAATVIKKLIAQFGIIEKIKNIFSNVWESITGAFSWVIDFIMGKMAQGLQFVTSTIQGLRNAFYSIIGFVSSPIETIKTIITGLGDTVASIWQTITDGCAGMANGITSTFTATFSGLIGIISAPIRGVISLMNQAIDGINSISVSIPDWVPGLGGKTFGVNIPKLPTFATGGFTTGPSIAGEAGKEAIISFSKSYRTENLGYLARAAQMLGVGSNDYATDTFMNGLTGSELITNNTSTAGDTSININYSPNVTIAGAGMTDANLYNMLKKHAADLADQIEEILEARKGGKYDTAVY